MKNYIQRTLSCFLSLILFISTAAFSPVWASTLSNDSLVLTECGSWFESAYAKWEAYDGADSYNAYYKPVSASKYTPVDAELVRGTRMDLPGLKGNTKYLVKIIPAINGTEITAAAATFEVTPAEHDRSGYAFFNGITTGGYNEDGTVPENANIVYVTNENKNTVTLNGYTGIAQILSESARKNDTTPLIVRFIGSVEVPQGASSYPDNMLTVKRASNVTIEGIGEDANIAGWGFNFQRSTNIEVRNLDFYWYPEDAIGFESHCSRVWVHHNNIRKGHQDNPKEADKADGDGGTDFKYTDYVTISYNHYEGAKKTSLCGLKENATYRLTFHHNYFDGTGSRTPRVRFFDIHVYNNYYNNVSNYGIGASVNSNIFSENNYFENTEKPMVISMQGNGGTTFSSENGGTIKAFGNKIVNCKKYLPGTDYYDASSRDEVIDFSAQKGGSVYNNFDTNADIFYVNDYILHTADEAKEIVLSYAGRMKSGITVSEPAEPELPSVPDVPAEPETPSVPEIPSEPETPSVPEIPSEPEAPSVPEIPAEPETPSVPEIPSEPEAPSVPEIPSEPEAPSVPEESNDIVALGTYAFNDATVSGKICTVSNIHFNVRSIESDSVKLRNTNTISFKTAVPCTLNADFSKAGIVLSTADGSISYNGADYASLEITASSAAVLLAPGTYVISGASAKDNTLLNSITLS